jgi:hypothetical protein
MKPFYPYPAILTNPGEYGTTGRADRNQQRQWTFTFDEPGRLSRLNVNRDEIYIPKLDKNKWCPGPGSSPSKLSQLETDMARITEELTTLATPLWVLKPEFRIRGCRKPSAAIDLLEKLEKSPVPAAIAKTGQLLCRNNTFMDGFQKMLRDSAFSPLQKAKLASANVRKNSPKAVKLSLGKANPAAARPKNTRARTKKSI